GGSFILHERRHRLLPRPLEHAGDAAWSDQQNDDDDQELGDQHEPAAESHGGEGLDEAEQGGGDERPGETAKAAGKRHDDAFHERYRAGKGADEVGPREQHRGQSARPPVTIMTAMAVERSPTPTSAAPSGFCIIARISSPRRLRFIQASMASRRTIEQTIAPSLS